MVKVPNQLDGVAGYFSDAVPALVVGLLGTGLIYEASRHAKETLAHDLWRDLGIASVVAAIVTLLYESYARARFDHKTVTAVIGSLMGDVVAEDVWDRIREQVLEKVAIRRLGTVHLKIRRDKRLGDGEVILSVRFEYKLCGIRSRRHRARVRHFLDSFMEPRLGLPRFEHISIGEEILDGRKEGKEFERFFNLSRHDEPLAVAVERLELVYMPGSYNLVMNEVTELDAIYVDEIPEDLMVEAHVYPRQKHDEFRNRKAVMTNTLLLPGQGIEFRFLPLSTGHPPHHHHA